MPPRADTRPFASCILVAVVLCDCVGDAIAASERRLNGSAVQCYTFFKFDTDNYATACPAECPYHTQCLKDYERSSCTRAGDCKYLLQAGQELQLGVQVNGTLVTTQECLACNISGCLTCSGDANGAMVCSECGQHFEPDGKGNCSWKRQEFDVLVYVFLGLLAILLIWVIYSLVAAELGEVTNEHALLRGLLVRRRAQLFMEADDGKYVRYPLNTGLHLIQSGEIMGPGLTLFMNWFVYLGLVGIWFCVGTALYAPSYEVEGFELDPCRQQERTKSGWDFRTANPLGERGGNAWRWAVWNYFGACAITALFLIFQQYLWGEMVEGKTRPALSEYCIMLTNVPPDLTDKSLIRKYLGDWMDQLCLDRKGIRSISIAYDIPPKKRKAMRELIELHLKEHAKTHEEQEPKRVPGRQAAELRADAKTSPADGVIVAEDTDGDQDVNPPRQWFWIQLLALIFFQTRFSCCSSERVSPDDWTISDRHEKAKHCLERLKGSGHVFVVMETEALARALVGTGVVKVSGKSDKRSVSCLRQVLRAVLCCRQCRRADAPSPLMFYIHKAPAEPAELRWEDYSHVPIGWRVLRLIVIVVALLAGLWVWLGLFAAFLSFEIATTGHKGTSKGVAGFFVGMLLPIGNALIGALIDLLMEHWGFQDEDDMRAWRQILNVVINMLANIGELYLVYKKVLDPNKPWGVRDFLWHLRNEFAPIGVNHSAHAFQQELLSILFPAGMIVPIFTIPLLSDILPFIIGRLRLKADPNLTAADAERIMKPGNVDPIGPYTDFVINFFLLSFCAWISPGTYLIILWLALCLWVLLLYLNMRMNILRWQARTYFGGKKVHMVAAYLLALPLGFQAAALDHQRNPTDHTGLMGMFMHMCAHYVFVKYTLPFTLEVPKLSYATSYSDMMKDEKAPIANYLNTNPIEVLRRHYSEILAPTPKSGEGCLDDYLVELGESSDSFDRGPFIYYRNDKWYLQTAGTKNAKEAFSGEDHVVIDGVWSQVKVDAAVLGRDVLMLGPRRPTAESSRRGSRGSTSKTSVQSTTYGCSPDEPPAIVAKRSDD